MPALLAVALTPDLLQRLSAVAEAKDMDLDTLVRCMLVASVHKAEHAAHPAMPARRATVSA